MQDDNVRRLLHYSSEERKQGVIDEGKGDHAHESTLRHFAIIKRSGNAKVDELVEISLARLSARVLWIDDYPEIPDRLGKIYSEGGGNWSAVYD